MENDESQEDTDEFVLFEDRSVTPRMISGMTHLGGVRFTQSSALCRRSLCVLCSYVMQKPFQIMSCGHHLCEDCLEKVITAEQYEAAETVTAESAGELSNSVAENDLTASTSNAKVCPFDGSPIQSDRIRLDNGFQVDLKKIRVICDKDECEWWGRIEELEAHRLDCVYEPVDCPNKCSLGASVPLVKKRLAEHLTSECPARIEACPYCSAEMIVSLLPAHYEAACPDYLVPCPNRCKAAADDVDNGDDEASATATSLKEAARKTSGAQVNLVKRGELETHLQHKCSRQTMRCAFESMGCDWTGSRSKMDIHLRKRMVQHADLVRIRLSAIQRSVTSNARQLIEHDQALKVGLNERLNHVEKLAGADQLLRVNVGQHRAGGLVRMVWRIDNIHQLVCGLAGGGEESVGDKSMTTTTSDSISSLSSGTSAGMSTTENVAAVTDAENGNVYSQIFYSHRNGYKLMLSFCPLGDGPTKRQFSAVYVCVCKGPNDNLLEWPFNLVVTFTLVDQRSRLPYAERSHIVKQVKPNPVQENMPFLGKPLGERNAFFGVSKFCPVNLITSESSYLWNDSIFIKFTIEL